MRLRERQRIFRRFFAGEALADIAWELACKHCKDLVPGYVQIKTEIESIIREGHAKNWDYGKREAK